MVNSPLNPDSISPQPSPWNFQDRIYPYQSGPVLGGGYAPRQHVLGPASGPNPSPYPWVYRCTYPCPCTCTFYYKGESLRPDYRDYSGVYSSGYPTFPEIHQYSTPGPSHGYANKGDNLRPFSQPMKYPMLAHINTDVGQQPRNEIPVGGRAAGNHVSSDSKSINRPETRPRTTGRRTRTGCFTCRKRRVKCDERKPYCLNCERSKNECSGYDLRGDSMTFIHVW